MMLKEEGREGRKEGRKGGRYVPSNISQSSTYRTDAQ